MNPSHAQTVIYDAESNTPIFESLLALGGVYGPVTSEPRTLEPHPANFAIESPNQGSPSTTMITRGAEASPSPATESPNEVSPSAIENKSDAPLIIFIVIWCLLACYALHLAVISFREASEKEESTSGEFSEEIEEEIKDEEDRTEKSAELHPRDIPTLGISWDAENQVYKVTSCPKFTTQDFNMKQKDEAMTEPVVSTKPADSLYPSLDEFEDESDLSPPANPRGADGHRSPFGVPTELIFVPSTTEFTAQADEMMSAPTDEEKRMVLLEMLKKDREFTTAFATQVEEMMSCLTDEQKKRLEEMAEYVQDVNMNMPDGLQEDLALLATKFATNSNAIAVSQEMESLMALGTAIGNSATQAEIDEINNAKTTADLTKTALFDKVMIQSLKEIQGYLNSKQSKDTGSKEETKKKKKE